MKVLNKRTDTIPPDAILVDRTTRWGNQFKIGMHYQGQVLTRQDAVDVHKDWLLNSDMGIKLLEDIYELTGKDLVCWCAPLPCHADVLLELANEEEHLD